MTWSASRREFGVPARNERSCRGRGCWYSMRHSALSITRPCRFTLFPSSAAHDAAMKGLGYRNYLLVVLLLVYAFNGVDNLALGLVLQDIKAELGLSDTQLGLLTGIAFALFYSIMGVPIARWADRGNRVAIITV